MTATEITVRDLVDKIRTLPSEDLAELATFVNYLHFRAQRDPETTGSPSAGLVHLRGLLSDYDTSPEALAELRSELWRNVQQ
jgi:hypothetical protein